MGNIFQAKLALAAAAANNIAASQSPGAGAILINGTVGTGNLDAARRILLTSGSDDSGITFTVIGKNRNGSALQETLAGGSSTSVYTTQDFFSVSSVTHTDSVAGTLEIGTNGVASTPWFNLNTAGNPPMNLGICVVVSGTINYTFEYTYDDPNAPFTGTFPTVFNITALAAKATSLDSSLVTPAFAVRMTQNSFTNPGTAAIIVIQSGIG